MTELRYRQISAEELARGDGQEGRPALVAYRGRVYDVTVSKLWRNGKHVNAHLAGNELTVEMGSAPHMDEVMAAFPVIGLYPDPSAPEIGAEAGTTLSQSAEAQAAAVPDLHEAPQAAAWLLAKHPHPISVHWPIALGFVAALLTLLELLWPLLPFSKLSPNTPDGPVHVSPRYLLQQASLINVLICALFAVPAIFTGWLSWYYNYQSKDSPVFRAKIFWSWVLGGLIVLTLFVRFALPFAGRLDGGLWYWVYSALVIAHGPVVIILGHYGGKITYPD